jgi:hypothetical protein
MKQVFYSHLVTFDDLSLELDSLQVSEDEKKHLLGIAASSIHYELLNTALSNLPKEHKKEFLLHIHNEDHEKAWHFLSDNARGIEDKIKQRAKELKEEFKKDIKDLKKNQA